MIITTEGALHVRLPKVRHFPLTRDNEPIRLLVIPTSPHLYVLIVNNNIKLRQEFSEFLCL